LTLVLVNILETRTSKATEHSAKARTTTRLVLRESQITYGPVARFFFNCKTRVFYMVLRRSRGLHGVDVKAVIMLFVGYDVKISHCRSVCFCRKSTVFTAVSA
jgi:hypothetical protein